MTFSSYFRVVFDVDALKSPLDGHVDAINKRLCRTVADSITISEAVL